MGIGAPRAKQLIESGITSINQLKTKKFYNTLPQETKLFISMKPNQKIPHDHIAKLEPYLSTPHLKATKLNDFKVTIVGSYRRNKPYSSDIDCMVVSDNPATLDIFLNHLNLQFKGNVHTYSKGQDKISTIINLQNIVRSKTPVVYKLDAFRTNIADEIPMLLYSTGSKEFNILMRKTAKKKGYLLNQKGLFKDGKLVPNLPSEKAYFDILQMDYKAPAER